MEPTTIAWVVPQQGADDAALIEPLRALGFRVLPCAEGESAQVPGDLRVLRADGFDDMRRLRREYVRDDRPTLVIASRLDQELEALEFLKPRDDVVRGSDCSELVAMRLLRLMKQAGGEALLRSREFVDELTGLPTRKRWHDQLARAIARGVAADTGAAAVVLFDLDHFKRINDRFGHQAGDKVLREFAALLIAEASPGDLVGRVGGEEFALLLARADADALVAEVQQLMDRLAAHTFLAPGVGDEGWEGAPRPEPPRPRLIDTMPADLDPVAAPAPAAPSAPRIAVTASAGLAFLDARSTVDEVLKQVDVAVYEAKSRGRNQLVLFHAMQETSGAEDRDLYVRHFENVTRVMTERMTMLVTTMGRSLVEAARREANQDALTQLHNRRYFDARLAREVELAAKHGRALTIALIDLDRFHDVNAAFGYPSGDHVLRRFSEIARNSVRLTDWLARYGGEEFCLVMPDTDLDTGARVAERVRRNIAAAQITSLDQRPIPLTVSIGAAQFGAGAEGPVSLVQRASDAVQLAKRSGRNRLVANG